MVISVPGPPEGLRALQSSVSSVLLTWLPPDPPTGEVLSYTLYHRPPHAHTTSHHPMSARSGAHTLHHLTKGTHNFWLRARTRMGEGPPTPTIELNLSDNGNIFISNYFFICFILCI